MPKAYLRRMTTKPLPTTTWHVTRLPDRSNPVKLTLILDTDAIGVVTMVENALRYMGIVLTREGQDDELKRRTG